MDSHLSSAVITLFTGFAGARWREMVENDTTSSHGSTAALQVVLEAIPHGRTIQDGPKTFRTSLRIQ